MRIGHFSFIALVACSHQTAGVDANDPHELRFHGEQPAFPGFSSETGAQPAGASVTLDLTFSATGNLTADAGATVGGSGDQTVVAGTPASGLFAIDAHLKAVAMLHVAVDGLPTYDGPIPNITALDIALADQVAFDPFLIGGKAHLALALPQTELAPIALGSVPGTLQITIAGTSTAQSDLSGVCAGLESSKVQFVAQTSTSATIVLLPTIVLNVPNSGDQTYPIPPITISIPSSNAALDLGTLDTPAGGARPTGTSYASNASCANAMCRSESAGAFSPRWVPPAPLHQHRCSPAQLDAFEIACGATAATSATCSTFLGDAANTDCSTCLATPDTASTYGALIESSLGGQLNVGGCIAALNPAQLGTAKTWQAVPQCEAASCSGCTASSSQDAATQCRYDADANACAGYNGAAQARYPTGLAATPCLAQSADALYRFYGNLFCGGD